MHMADALISGTVSGVMMAVSVVAGARSVKVMSNEIEEKKIPFMGVMGAFVFAAQMINFTIPGTGSSGHIGGGMLLSALLGPHAGFLTIAVVLLIQALFFGDGGLLAYGCNLFNIGFYPCFIGYVLIYKRMLKKKITTKRIFAGSIISVVVALQMGAFSVVLETLFSGKTELPFTTFLLLMQPIHLAIGVVEGIITGAMINFVWKARPEILESVTEGKSLGNVSTKKVLTAFLIAVVIVGGVLSWFASSNPDGLEWSLERTAGTSEFQAEGQLHDKIGEVQDKTAVLPDYGFKTSGDKEEENEESWPAVSTGTSVSGILGGAVTLLFVVIIGAVIKAFSRKKLHS